MMWALNSGPYLKNPTVILDSEVLKEVGKHDINNK